MAAITGYETVTYNGFTFPSEADVQITQTPVMDQARRVETYNEYTITVTALIGEYRNPNLDGRSNELWSLPFIRTRLSKSGRTLIVKHTGFGDLSVFSGDVDDPPATSNRKDVAWGPHVGPLVWEPWGPHAARVVWTCKVHIIECEADGVGGPRPFREPPARNRNLLAYNYTVSHAIDEQGYTTRTIAGYLEIPLGRKDGEGNPEVEDTADTYWNLDNTPAVPEGFRRVANQTALSEDRRRLNFSVTDAEMPEKILPPGVLEARVSHTASTNHKALIKWQATIRASITLHKGIPKSRAWHLFLLIVAQRLAAARQGNGPGGGMQAFIPVAMTAEDSDVYGRQAGNFSFSYLFTIADEQEAPEAAGNGPFAVPQVFFLHRFLSRSALWGPAPTAAWNAWANSVPGAFAPRGQAGLYQTALDDWLIDICDPDDATPGRRDFRLRPPNFPDNVALNIPVPRRFFLLYNTSLTIWLRQGTVVTRRSPPALPATSPGAGGGSQGGGGGDQRVPSRDLGRSPASPLGAVLPGGGGTLVNNQTGGFTAYLSNNVVAPNQELVANEFERTTPVVLAVLFFDIVLCGEPPAPPYLSGVAGVARQDIIPAAAGEMPLWWPPTSVTSRKVANLFGVDVWRATGWKSYVLRNAPPNIPNAPPNFFINDNDKANKAAFGGFLPLNL